MCNCELRLNKLYSEIFDPSGYDEHFDDNYKIMTWGFTKHVDQIEIMCPRHHDFFIFLTNKLNLKFPEATECIVHAWCHKPTKTLRLIWSYEEEHQKMKWKLLFGLRKAWRIYTKQYNTVETYCYDSGGVVPDYEANNEDYSN